jgi:Adenosine deaminase
MHAVGSDVHDACKIETRFPCQVLRGLPREIVFAQALLCFEVAATAPDTVAGINFVMPEDARLITQDYALQMRMAKVLHETYPSVHVSLHAGEVLGLNGRNHPLPMYRWFGVPVALATDDEGVARTDLTNEYVRAVETYDLKYLEVKNMVQTGLEHAFLPGDSLWAKPDDFTKFAAGCATHRSAAQPSAQCVAFLRGSLKAQQQQWELEWRFQTFEADF